MSILAEADRIAGCGENISAHRCPECGHQYKVPVRCHSRVCDRCGYVSGKQLQDDMLTAVRSVMSQKRRGWTVALLTLTISSARFGPDGVTYEDLKKAGHQLSDFMRLFYAKFQGRRSRHGKIVAGDKYRGAGALAVMELDQRGNLHFHCFTYGPFIPQRLLSTEWNKITGDSYIVDIRAVKGGSAAAVAYVLKYITKPPALEAYSDLARYALVIKGIRRLRQFGILYNKVKKPKRKIMEPFYCLFDGKLLKFAGIHADPGDKLIDWLTLKKFTDRKAGRFLGPLLDRAMTVDKDWSELYEPDYQSNFANA